MDSQILFENFSLFFSH